MSNIPEIKLSYSHKQKKSQRSYITSSFEAYKIFRGAWDLSQIDFIESVYVILLRADLSIIGYFKLSTGGMNSSIIDVKVLFAAVLKSMAIQFIIAHNHPSGSLNFSREDLSITKQIGVISKSLGVEFADHIIITRDSFKSMRDEGHLKK